MAPTSAYDAGVRPRLVLLGALLVLPAPRADALDADPVVVHVGDASLRVSDVTRRLASIPDFQLRTFGSTPEQIRAAFVDAVLVPELLYGEEAARLHLKEQPDVRHRIDAALARALTNSLRADTVAAGVTEDDVRAYYDSHRGEYHQPVALRLFRILLDDESLAKRILSEAAGAGGPARWRDSARAHSLDTATKMRGGDLGFVFPDGHTDVPQLDVDPALYDAASKVRDGEVVPLPIKEGGHLAVVWRRGSRPKADISFAAAHASIRDRLLRARTQRAVDTLRDALRARNVNDENPALLDDLTPRLELLPPRPRPSAAPFAARPVPEPTDRGLR